MQGMDVELHLFLIWAVVSVTVGGWLDQRAGVDVWENRKMSNPVGHCTELFGSVAVIEIVVHTA
jgi:hypothetical protein